MGEVGLGAEFSRIDVGAFQVHAEYAGAAGWPLFAERAELTEHARNFFHRRRHGGGQQRGGAKAHVGTGNGLEGARTFHDVGAATAMHMQVDKARQQVGQVVVGRVARRAVNGDNLAVLMHQATTHPAAGREDIVFSHGQFSKFAFRRSSHGGAALRQSRSSRCGSRCR
ncbi:hypothetical protein PFLmoz3_00277 [Pseudomonas fluorescens]|uniref:Uncharacterized protein n=1 Tax=Pseudomonas fluorescens TaxID=294 RepID=A0A120G9E4_PSEFL|nr:hypothetical protein PFLmoz3_00277 [Pseudomonas fluorescens]